MVALRPMYYKGNRAEGEEFDAKPELVRMLVSAKSARIVEPAKREYKRRDMQAEK